MSDSFTMKRIEMGPLGENCYIIFENATGETAVIDPGLFNAKLREAIGDPTKVKYILLTHGHFDHVTGVPELKALTGAEIVIHSEDEAGMKRELPRSLSSAMPEIKADRTVNDGDALELGTLSFRVLHTPGHTKGGVCYILEDVIFSGDTLFLHDIGRMDFPGGDWREMVVSLQRLADLPGDYTVYPGHGPLTTLEFERKNNRYFGKKNYDDFTQ